MLDVTCALIRNDEGELLIVQRPGDSDHPFMWEFPGGKIAVGESDEDCIIREIGEELSLDIVICGRLSPVEHDYGIKKIRLIPFICDTLIDLPILNEHIDFRWIEPDELGSVTFSEADIPVAREYQQLYGQGMTRVDRLGYRGEVDEKGIAEILGGPISVDACNMLASSAVENEDILKVLLKFSLVADKTLAFRSSWCVSKAVDIDRAVIEPFRGELVQALPNISNESVIRSILKIISESDMQDIDEKGHGIIASCCFEWLNSAASAIAIKVYSMESIFKLTAIYPELAEELRSSLQRLMEDGSAAIKSRGNYVLERMRKGVNR